MPLAREFLLFDNPIWYPMQPEKTLLNELVNRIVDAVHPLQIILFGSSARDEMHQNSDLDVMVVVPNGTHCRKTAQKIYRRLVDLGCAKDVIVATPSLLDAHKDNEYLVYHSALTEGKTLYHAIA
jgi:predicted nucleotidyltransferase